MFRFELLALFGQELFLVGGELLALDHADMLFEDGRKREGILIFGK